MSLQEWLDAHGMEQKELARRMGMRPETVNRVCNGKPASPEFIMKFWRTQQVDTDTLKSIFEQVPA